MIYEETQFVIKYRPNILPRDLDLHFAGLTLYYVVG